MDVDEHQVWVQQFKLLPSKAESMGRTNSRVKVGVYRIGGLTRAAKDSWPFAPSRGIYLVFVGDLSFTSEDLMLRW